VFQQPKIARKLLIVGSPQPLKIVEITALAPFSTATRFCNSYAALNVAAYQ
jgi:hypothetical protein